LHVTGVTGDLAGGRLTGQFAVDTASPPHVSVQGAVAGAEIGGSLLDGPLDLTAGRTDATVALDATGFSPAALLATLDGEAHVTVLDGAMAGLDLPAITAALAGGDPAAVQPGVVHALDGGATGFTRLDAVVTARRGAVAVQHATLTAPGGTVALTGTLDLPIDTADLHLAVTPSVPGAPVIGLRLIGPGDAPRRTPELADLARWLLVPP
jgi:uncharacterized protein involved in outer membrane biogenesis